MCLLSVDLKYRDILQCRFREEVDDEGQVLGGF
jgi:hypothetical protein